MELLRGQGGPDADDADESGRLYEAFGEVGDDAEEADVEFALDAQREVVEGA